MRQSAHFSEGHVPVAFVFSAPGEKESRLGKPVAGATGDNLEAALVHLHASCPGLFLSEHRYDYRITNAWPDTLAVSLGHGGSEALDTQIQDARNVQRVLRELEGCDVVILSGRKAQLLARALNRSGKTVVDPPHVGNTGLNVSYEIGAHLGLVTPQDRRAHRVQLWANAVLKALRADCS